MDDNPYRAPEGDGYERPEGTPYVGRAGSGRFLAAQIDHAFGVVIFLAVGMNIAETVGNVGAGLIALAAYLGYYLVPEYLFGATVGKSLFALQVRCTSGKRCTLRQVAIRTALRLVEVNPLLLGAIPAGIAILSTQRKQRIGDLLAGTVVVRYTDLTQANPAGPAIKIVRR